MGRLMRLVNEAYDMPEIHGNAIWLVRVASHMGNPLPHVKGGDTDVIGGCVAEVDVDLKMTVCMKSGETMFGVFCGSPDSAISFTSHKKSDVNVEKMAKRGLDAISIRGRCRKDLAPDSEPEQAYKSDSPLETIEHVEEEE